MWRGQRLGAQGWKQGSGLWLTHCIKDTPFKLPSYYGMLGDLGQAIARMAEPGPASAPSRVERMAHLEAPLTPKSLWWLCPFPVRLSWATDYVAGEWDSSMTRAIHGRHAERAQLGCRVLQAHLVGDATPWPTSLYHST